MKRASMIMSNIGRRCAPPMVVVVSLLLCATTSTMGQGSDVKVVEIQIGDNMRYSPSVIDAQPGQRLRVILKAVGKLQALAHNFVLLKKGTDPKSFADRTAAVAGETGLIPPVTADEVIVATSLVKSGTSGEVSFEAPTQSGEYPFVCTFPGHFNLGMKGRLIVK
jgi:azurin